MGTYQVDSLECLEKAVSELGYKMYDCASWYENEELVGQAIKNCGKERKDIYITSKVWWDEVEDCEAACRRSLAKLGVD